MLSIYSSRMVLNYDMFAEENWSSRGTAREDLPE